MTLLTILDSHHPTYLTGEIISFTLYIDQSRSFILER